MAVKTTVVMGLGRSGRAAAELLVRQGHRVVGVDLNPDVPPIPGVKKTGVFVYRTIEDLEHIIAYSKKAKSCAVIGGGLLGLEAAKAALVQDRDALARPRGPRRTPSFRSRTDCRC